MEKICYIDIDDTIAVTDIILIKEAIDFNKFYLKRNSKVDMGEYNNHYYFAEMLNWSMQDMKDFYNNRYPDYLKNLDVKPYVCESIYKLHQNGFKIVFLSSRVEKNDLVMPITKKWLSINSIYYDEVIVNCANKYDYLEDKSGFFIDDSYENCCNVSTLKCFKVIQISSRYGKKSNENNIKSLDNWNDISDYIIESWGKGIKKIIDSCDSFGINTPK